jgi:seryl-tRNA synthetase
MLDITFVRENPEKARKGTVSKGMDPSFVDKVLELDTKRRELIQKVEETRKRRNEIAKGGERNEAGKEVKDLLKALEPELKLVEEELKVALNLIPNMPLDMVPEGNGEKDNVEVRKWGVPKKFKFTPKDHIELGKSLGILDFETGAKVSGSQFYFKYGDGVLLDMALVNYALDLLSKEGFMPVATPDLAKSRYYLGTGYSPRGNEAQTYEIKDEDLGLIATAEVTLAGKHADEIIPEEKLPIKYVGYSHCFRQEAGAYGKYSKGLYRVHQFTKVEMFIYCTPEESNKMHQLILQMEEKIYQGLELPYRVVEMCTGDLGAMAARKFDIEAWMPTRGEYGEVTSTSNCTDYQARNLNIKTKRKDGTNEYLHMINGTAVVTSRVPLAIMENFQTEDGSIVVPEVLRKWMGKDIISLRK